MARGMFVRGMGKRAGKTQAKPLCIETPRVVFYASGGIGTGASCEGMTG